jgi:hypothetical protein
MEDGKEEIKLAWENMFGSADQLLNLFSAKTTSLKQV